jgi:hypothetical protein
MLDRYVRRADTLSSDFIATTACRAKGWPRLRRRERSIISTLIENCELGGVDACAAVADVLRQS